MCTNIITIYSSTCYIICEPINLQEIRGDNASNKSFLTAIAESVGSAPPTPSTTSASISANLGLTPNYNRRGHDSDTWTKLGATPPGHDRDTGTRLQCRKLGATT